MSDIETTQEYAKSITGCSSGNISFFPPLASQTSLEDLISSVSSDGSIENGLSGPGQLLDLVKCFQLY